MRSPNAARSAKSRSKQPDTAVIEPAMPAAVIVYCELKPGCDGPSRLGCASAA